MIIYYHSNHHMFQICSCTSIDTTNKFVSINYEMASNTITCVFDGDHVHLGRLKSCSILYGIGSTEGPYCNFSTLSPLWTNSNSSNSSNHVYITIADDIQRQQSPPQEYCFTATAKYGKQTVIINGSFVTVVGKNHFQCDFSTT